MRRSRLPAYTVYLVISGAGAFFFTLFGFASGLYRVQTAQLSPLELLLLGAALEGAVLLFEVPTGIVADVYSRRLSVILSSLFAAISSQAADRFNDLVTIEVFEVVKENNDSFRCLALDVAGLAS